jgi:hypothetical protein
MYPEARLRWSDKRSTRSGASVNRICKNEGAPSRKDTKMQVSSSLGREGTGKEREKNQSVRRGFASRNNAMVEEKGTIKSWSRENVVNTEAKQ